MSAYASALGSAALGSAAACRKQWRGVKAYWRSKLEMALS